MLTDVVLDTNVLVHAENPGIAYYQEARALLLRILSGTVSWCVDIGFHIDEAQNRSHLTSEYRAKLDASDLGLAVLAALAADGRVKEVSFGPPATRKRIRQLVANKMDQKFLAVATQTDDRVLVSHDFTDFPNRRRAQIRSVLEVDVIIASDARERLEEGAPG